jgi:alpha-glucosidase (family GH31 glycosyl hydrolase)
MNKLLYILSMLLIPVFQVSAATVPANDAVTGIRQLNGTTVEVVYNDGKCLTLDFYGNNIFRMFQDNAGGIVREPESTPPAKILVQNPRKNVDKLRVTTTDADVSVSTGTIRVDISRGQGLMRVTDLRTGRQVMAESQPVSFKRSKYTVSLSEQPDEYFYGGGVQNGRFSHRGHKIEIVNTNSWTDGGVASPAPFYWSTAGYAVMGYTFAPGLYDFGATAKGMVTLTHDANYLDMFVMVDAEPVSLLNDYYQLTGNPVLLPKFAFYEGHLNAYNRDYWKETTEAGKGILFEDGKRYIESQKDNGGIKESLNGEKNNYQFSARAVVDRYKAHDMPLGWVLPNDGYGAGYGQTETLDGNIANLKSFGDYARKNGVEIGLWTQSNLHPVDGVSALLQRDIVKEVRDAGVRVLKTDVAWVGDGYSFGLNGIADVAHIMPYYGSDARPFIISLDGWAGSQRYAGIWSGDQTGGKWEYIRFHIPTYIGAGLSGLGNITSDMDGIFGGKNVPVNVRDFQWKTFTPMQLNMDGWGSNPKYPHILGEPAASINRSYLKFKSMLLPYTYSLSHEALTGKPLMRAMFLDYPSDYTHGSGTQYQYMYGPCFLVAPIYQDTEMDADGNDLRNGIYLPEGTWIDYFNGDVYGGNQMINNFAAPIWKLPLFVKAGAIIPLNNPNNNPSQINRDARTYEVYPSGKSSFCEYDDDGTTEAYLNHAFATTMITSSLSASGRCDIVVEPTVGAFDGMVKMKSTEFIINLTARPKTVRAFIGNAKSPVALREVPTMNDLAAGSNVYFYDKAPQLNRFATPGSDFAKVDITKNPQLLVKLASTDITRNKVTLHIDGYQFAAADKLKSKTGALSAPADAAVKAADATAYTLTPTWQPVANADFYEIEYDGIIYSTIRQNKLLFNDLAPETAYDFKVRAVNKSGVSPWTSFSATTKSNPLEFAIQGITGKTDAKSSEDHEVTRLFDFSDKGDIWFAEMDKSGKPFVLTMDLHGTRTLDKMRYLPREGGSSGTFLKGSVAISTDGTNWTEVGPFEWKANDDAKEVKFEGQPQARYIRFTVTEAVRNYLSGREIYVFKVPGTKTLIPGDVNQDGKIDSNDLTSYVNYTGLRRGDSDFDGYISKGDINNNGLIDAADISEVATRLDGGAVADNATLAGEIAVTPEKTQYNAGEDVKITVSGKGLKAVNALDLILPYSERDMQFVSIEPLAVKGMQNMTNDRLHKDGSKVLYPTFVNVGDQPTLNGDADLFVVHFKALRKLKLAQLQTSGMLVDKSLNVLNF